MILLTRGGHAVGISAGAWMGLPSFLPPGGILRFGVGAGMGISGRRFVDCVILRGPWQSFPTRPEGRMRSDCGATGGDAGRHTAYWYTPTSHLTATGNGARRSGRHGELVVEDGAVLIGA